MAAAPDHDTPFSTYLASNASWASSLSTSHPSLLAALASGQAPPLLWIGCSDSRVPETTLLNLPPGSVFTHRNIANLVHGSDLSLSAVLEYGIRHLKVRHVVLCGHTACGGAAGALADKSLGVLDPWLLPLRLLAKEKKAELDALPEGERAARLVELNVQRGLETLRSNFAVREGVQAGTLDVHGLVYDVGTGLLRELDL